MSETSLAVSVVNEVKKAVVGKDDVIFKALLVILARGHLLLEDIPGVGKTTLALAFSKALGLSCNRVQFTPDVMPSDLTGFSLYNKDTGRMEYQPGALLCNLFLADELNRATSRTQSALLEAMEEGRVTVDGATHPIPEPFLVIATQNPAGASGTQLLPDSQLDRFSMRLSMGYPSPEDELELLRRKAGGNPLDSIVQAASHEDLARLRSEVDTRESPRLAQGASPRAAIAVAALSRAAAWTHGRDFVVPDDVKLVWTDAVAHRLILPTGAVGSAERTVRIADAVLASVPAPRLPR